MNFRKAKTSMMRLGHAGESAACRALQSKGIEILARNCRLPKGEIDIVARDGLTLVFVEVKTFRFKRWYPELRPAGMLHRHQMGRIYRAAFSYMKEIGSPQVPFRFDLVEVVSGFFGPVRLRHWQSHFGRDAVSRRRKG